MTDDSSRLPIIRTREGDSDFDSILPDESASMMREQHLALQRAIRLHTQVKVQEKPFGFESSIEPELGEGYKAHPLLSHLQQYDGVDTNLSAILSQITDPEVRRDLENQLRYEHQKKMEKQLGAQHVATPKPQGL